MRGSIGSLSIAAMLASGSALAEERPHPRTDYTAYTRGAGRASIGLFKLEMGLLDQVMVGTYLPLWFTSPAIGVPVPNAYLKMGQSWGDWLAVATRAGFTFIDGEGVASLADEDTSASAVIYAVEVDGTVRVASRISLTLGVDYNHVSAVGDTEQLATSIEGASTADTWSARLLSEWHLSESFAINVLLRALIYQSPLNADFDSDNEVASVQADLSGESSRGRRFSIVPGLSYEGEHWEFTLGVGYGVVYLPVLGLPTTKSWPVVDLGFSYNFDIY
jgi:hypothetical protein